MSNQTSKQLILKNPELGYVADNILIVDVAKSMNRKDHTKGYTPDNVAETSE